MSVNISVASSCDSCVLQKVHVQAFDPAEKFAVEEVLADRTIVEPLDAALGKVPFANVYAEPNVRIVGCLLV